MDSPPLDAERLFHRVFWPLYPEDARADLARARITDANPGKNEALAAQLEEVARVFVKMAPSLFEGVDLALDFSDASVHRLGAALTRERRDAWLARGAEGTAENELFNLVVHGVAYVGECARRGREARWSLRRPLWESLVELKSAAGEGELAVFQWWLKSLADDAFAPGASGLADRYRALVEVPSADLGSLPVIAPPDRRLPRITKPRYDVLYKHLKAHLPELKDLGHDFPSPERFADIGFRWLDFVWLGEGRMLLLFGPGEGGLHLFWLDAKGFQKAAFFPADSFPDPVVRLDAEGRLRVMCAVEKKQVTHELLWWGP